MARRKILVVVAALGGGLALPAMAQQAAEQKEAAPSMLDTVVVSANRTEEPISAIPGSVIVIGRDEIEKQLKLSSNPARLLQKLVPGYAIGTDMLSNASENFRGRSTLVMVDGVARNTPLRDISRMLSGVDLNNIERIEVINGASAAFGNGATGGAINFITKQGSGQGSGKPEITGAVGLRAFTTNIADTIAPELSAGFRGDAGPVDVVANMSAKYSRDYYDGRGDRIPSDAMLGQGGGDNIADYNGLVKVGKSFDARRLEASANVVRLDQEPDYFTNYATRPVSVLDNSPYTGQSIAERSEFYRTSYSDGDFFLGNLRLDLSYSDIERRTALAPLSAANTLVYYTSGPLTRLNTDGQLTLSSKQMALQTAVTTPLPMLLEGMKLTWGADIGQDKTVQRFLDGVDAIAPMKQNNYAAYAQLDAPVLDWLRLRGGVRYDRFDVDLTDFVRPAYTTGAAVVAALRVKGGSFTYDAVVYNAGMVVDLLPGLELFGGMSQGYSLPDFGGFTRRAGVQGVTSNFSLLGPQPAKVTTYETGLRGQNDRMSGGISGYVSESDLGTTFITTTNQISQQKERIYGLEAYGEFSLTDTVTLGSTLSWKEGKFDSNRDGDIDAYLPNNRIGSPLKLVLFAGWEIDSDWTLHGETVFYSDRTRFDGTNVTKLDSGFLVNALASYKLGQGDLSFGVENLFDHFAYNPSASATRNSGVAALGRTVAMRYSHKF